MSALWLKTATLQEAKTQIIRPTLRSDQSFFQRVLHLMVLDLTQGESDAFMPPRAGVSSERASARALNYHGPPDVQPSFATKIDEPRCPRKPVVGMFAMLIPSHQALAVVVVPRATHIDKGADVPVALAHVCSQILTGDHGQTNQRRYHLSMQNTNGIKYGRVAWPTRATVAQDRHDSTIQ